MQAIKNIIFDLGGVFMNLDYSKTRNAFINAGVANFDELYSQHHVTPVFHQIEVGKITSEEFYEGVRKETGLSISNEIIKHAWNAMLLDFPKERIDWLVEISKRYKIFLFSNTNQIHYDSFIEIANKSIAPLDFNSIFIKAYYSHHMGLRKPDAESFEFILKEQSLNAAETLFIDDTIGNIEGAKKVGLQTIHLTKPTTVLDLNL
jgi:putative hydrolase of the HAD superfamily